MTERLHELARYLQPFFLEEPPNLYARGWSKVREGRRLFRRFRHLSGDQLVGPRAVRHRLARRVRRTALRVRRGEAALPREQRLRHARAAVPAGDGDRAAVPHALGRRAPHPGIQRARDRRDGLDHAGDGRGGSGRGRRDPDGRDRSPASTYATGGRPGSRSRTGPRSRLGVVLSNADPKRTFLGLVEKSDAARGLPRRRRGDRDGRPVREGEPRPGRGAAMERDARGRRPQPAFARDARADARSGRSGCTTSTGGARSPTSCGWTASPRRTSTTRSRPPGTHVMTAFVQYVPFELRSGTWDERRDELGRKVVETISTVLGQRRGLDPRDAGRHAAGSGAHLRSHRGQHLPRRPERRAAVLHAAAAGVVALPDADRRAVPVRRRHASGWRRDRGARLRRRRARSCGT